MSTDAPGSFWLELGKAVVLHKVPAVVDRGYQWAMTATEDEIHALCGMLPLVQAKALRRAIAAIRNEDT